MHTTSVRPSFSAHPRWRPTLLVVVMVLAVAGTLAWAGFSAAPAFSDDSNGHPSGSSRTGQAGSDPTSARARLTQAVCGTWVLYQVSSKEELERLRPQIRAALALPGVAGLSVRFPWDVVDIKGDRRSHPILKSALEIARSKNKALSIRFMAGAHTPDRVFDSGAAYYRAGTGQKVPLPWSNSTGDHQVFLKAYDNYVGRLAAWSRNHGVRLLHLSWYGQDWAELNHGLEVRSASRYTQARWLKGHRQLIAVGARHDSRRLAVELPLSGYGPLSGGQSAAPTMEVERQFDRVWNKPVMRGRQMIQPDGYDWSRVFDRLDQVDATYAEVYLPSFWQVPGPAPAFRNNTRARIAQLEQEIAAFARRTC